MSALKKKKKEVQCKQDPLTRRRVVWNDSQIFSCETVWTWEKQIQWMNWHDAVELLLILKWFTLNDSIVWNFGYILTDEWKWAHMLLVRHITLTAIRLIQIMQFGERTPAQHPIQRRLDNACLLFRHRFFTRSLPLMCCASIAVFAFGRISACLFLCIWWLFVRCIQNQIIFRGNRSENNFIGRVYVSVISARTFHWSRAPSLIAIRFVPTCCLSRLPKNIQTD